MKARVPKSLVGGRNPPANLPVEPRPSLPIGEEAQEWLRWLLSVMAREEQLATRRVKEERGLKHWEVARYFAGKSNQAHSLWGVITGALRDQMKGRA